MEKNNLCKLENIYLAHNYNSLKVILTRGSGVWVYDIYGRKYLDCLSSYSALNLGHCYPKLIRTVQKQLSRLTLTSRAFMNDQLGFLAKELCIFTGYEMFLPMNTGAEAVETALKVARKWGYRFKKIKKNKAEIIVFKNNFHGRTITIVSFSSENQYKDGFGPYTPGFKIVEFNDIKALQKAINKNTLAILMEPIQGEGGIIFPKPGFLQFVQTICKKNKILFILDEIQTGFGRTGKLFAYQHEKDVKPDILIIGKSLGGGIYPISGILSRREIMNVFHPGDHGSTFGGNPMSCAVARKVLEIFHDHKILDNCATMGEYFINEIKKIKSRYIEEVRGKGLFIGIQLRKDSGGARRFCEKLAMEGLLCKETHDLVLRLSPALIIKKNQIDFALSKLKKVLTI